MKALRRFVAVLPLVFMTSCDLLNNFLNPKLPDQIKSNTNHSPRANLVINPESGYSPLNANIFLDGTDEDNESMKYQVRIDYNKDGTIDEIIPAEGSFSSSPIDITRTFNTGNSIIYGTVKDSRGLKSERNIEVIVSEPTDNGNPTTNILPTASLSVSPTSGQYPLTTNISLTGTDSDGIVTGYKLEIDLGEDGTIDKRIPETGFSPNPINTIEIFNSVGNARIYGIVKDNKDGETKKSISISALERNDLTAKIDFAPSYHVGDKFNFSAEVQNNTANEITVTNSSASPNLEYKLIKEDGTLVFDKKFPYDFLIRMHKMGTIKLSYQDTTVTTTISNVYIESKLIPPIDILPSLFPYGTSKSISDPGEQLNEAGNYYLQTIARYSMDGNNYQVTLNSEQFNVAP